jgi:hypothetical protein
LRQWRDEIEGDGLRKVVAARVYTNRSTGVVHLPRDVEERDLLLPYFRNTNFLKELLATHALNINENLDGRFVHYILLNMARAAEWGRYEEAVVGREMGRAWLYSQNYSFPVFEGKQHSCLAVMSADMLQNRLIRAELERRGIDYLPYWTSMLDTALAAMEESEPKPHEEIPVCRLMSQMALWVEVRTGLSSERWPGYERFEAQMRRHYPILEQNTADLQERISGTELGDQEAYDNLLHYTLNKMYGFVTLVLRPPTISRETLPATGDTQPPDGPASPQ